MARAHGRFSQLYVATTSGGTASPLTHAGKWTLNLNTDQVEVTAFGDTTKTYVTGLADGKLSFEGFMSDTASSSLVAAALDGQARKFYAYPFASTGIYFFGTMFFDTNVETDVSGAVAMKGTGSPATPIGTIGL